MRHQLLQYRGSIFILALRFQDQRFVVRNLQRILHQRGGLLQVFHGQIKLALATVNLGHAQGGGGILRVGILDGAIFIQRGVNLVVIGQVLGQTAHGVQIFLVHGQGLPERGDGILVIFLLLVSGSQGGINFGRTLAFGDRLQ